ncbi:unnamed protein product [Calypogeia fissa]
MQLQRSISEDRPRSELAKTQLMDAQMHRWRSTLCLLALLLVFGHLAEAGGSVCKPNSAALEALHSTQKFTVQTIEHIGYGFYFHNPALSEMVGGSNVTRGLVILPEDGIEAAAYAPYARAVALFGYYVVIVSEVTPGRVVEAIMQHPELVYWSLAGHGTGGELAARMAMSLQPKVKSLVLIASVLPPDLDFKSVNLNLFLTVIYSDNDTISTPADVTNSFSRVMGDTKVIKISGLGHFDFAYSTCLGNTKAPSNEFSSITSSSSNSSATIYLAMMYACAYAHWASGTEKALSYGDNHYLTPGFNDSKPYPGDILVRFDELPIPGTLPQRTWWVFTPSRIKGGIVYYAGAAVDGRAYFPMAFQIAARGHLVVIVQQPSRNATLTFWDANTVIDSNLTIFSGVPNGRWAISGHSQGGAGSTCYVSCFSDKIYGAVLHGGRWLQNTSSSEMPVLQIYGNLDELGKGNNTNARTPEGLFNPNKTTFVVVEGANHYKVGDYGYQVPDHIATISLEEQHEIFAIQTVNFLDSLETKSYAPITSGPVCPTNQLIGDYSSTELGLTHETLWNHKHSGLANSIEFGAVSGL